MKKFTSMFCPYTSVTSTEWQRYSYKKRLLRPQGWPSLIASGIILRKTISVMATVCQDCSHKISLPRRSHWKRLLIQILTLQCYLPSSIDKNSSSRKKGKRKKEEKEKGPYSFAYQLHMPYKMFSNLKHPLRKRALGVSYLVCRYPRVCVALVSAPGVVGNACLVEAWEE